MTLAYDTEMLRVALDRTIDAANAMMKHEHPDWLLYRIFFFRCECQSLRDAMAQHAKEEGAAQ